MKRRIWLWVLLVVAVLAAVALISYKVKSHRDEAAFREQLRLARAEGIPTNAAEFAATIPPAAPSENAASLYRRLRGAFPPKVDLVALQSDLLFHPSAASLAAAKEAVGKATPVLKIVDQAVKLPRCWFDRDWSQGMAVLFREYSDMKQAAKFLALRASIAATEGREKEGVADVQRIFRIAEHSGEEPQPIARWVGEAIYAMGVGYLADWSFLHRDRPVYREALKKALDNFPPPNLKDEHRGDLYNLEWLVENSLTAEGRKKIGLKEQDIPPIENLMPLLLSRAKSRIAIVKAERDYWAALDQPANKRTGLLERANRDLLSALLAYPTAAKVYEMFGGGDDRAALREPEWQARNQQYYGFLRAVSEIRTPHSIKTNDLLSPFDGKPLSYKYDGRQIVIAVSGFEADSKPNLLKFPPDKRSARR